MTSRKALARTLLISREFLPDSVTDQEILGALLGVRVVIAANDENISSPAGQAAVAALVGQMLGLGATIGLAMPETPLVRSQPPLEGERLVAGLVDLGRDHVPGASVQVGDLDGALVIAIGGTPVLPNRTGWRIGASSWRGILAQLDASVGQVEGVAPFGALVAATMVTGEIYKHAMRQLRARLGLLPEESLARIEQAEFTFGDDVDLPDAIELGNVDVVSGGAITHAVLHALLRVPGLRGLLRVIEPGLLDASNLNRYALQRRSVAGMEKAQHLQDFSTEFLRIKPVTSKFQLSEADKLAPLAPVIIVGADSLQARWDAQAANPAWLGIGASANFFVQVSEHVAGEPGCAGCAHPRDDGVAADIPTVSFVSYFAGLLLAARLVRRALVGPEPRNRRMTEIWPLRLDNQPAVTWRAVERIRSCPVCGSSGRAAPSPARV